MNYNKFSIIIPTFNRQELVQRALWSLINQDYPKDKYEIIIVDDGSTDKTIRQLNDMGQYISALGVKVIVHEILNNQGRIAARNKGMEIASNEWICWLDSDDEYLSTYLSTVNKAINLNPKYNLINFGAVVFDEEELNYWVRDKFEPAIVGAGHEKFKSGHIGTGSFVFRKFLWDKYIKELPETIHAYGGDDSFPALCTKKWPELAELYGQNESGDWLPFGNPWGDDWIALYLMTREHTMKPINIPLYIQHLRR